ncbi:MAG: Gfo/Idh/MocA family oxidoreductase [Planctomycetota bacterium]
MSEIPPIRVGVLGLGFMGTTHFRAYRSAAAAGYACEVVAVCDRRDARRNGSIEGAGNIGNDGAERLFEPGEIRGYSKPEELFAAADVDLVSVCTYTDSHVDLACAALESGKHVLVEKPVALQLDGVRKLQAVAASSSGRCMPAMCMRFWPGWTWLRDRVDDASLGPVRRAIFRRVGSPPAWASEFYSDSRRSGSGLFDLHIHDVDFLYSCFGAPQAVKSEGTQSHVTTHYQYDNGPEVIAEGGWLEPGTEFCMECEFQFEAGTARFQLGSDIPLTLEQDGVVREIGASDDPRADYETGYDGEVRRIVRCALDPSLPLPVTLDDAAAVTTLLGMERASMESGASVSWPSEY